MPPPVDPAALAQNLSPRFPQASQLLIESVIKRAKNHGGVAALKLAEMVRTGDWDQQEELAKLPEKSSSAVESPGVSPNRPAKVSAKVPVRRRS